MQKKILIGITYTGSTEKHGFYVNWTKGNDDIDIITLSSEKDNLAVLDQLDGVVMSGGVDVHPKNYNHAVVDYPNAPDAFNDERDAFETAVFKRAMDLHIPVLAICRGMQLVNCILGGDLVQDLGIEKNKLHRNTDAHKTHNILITKNSLLHQITDKEKDISDSAHHQCINRLGQGLMINAMSEDGIVEGIEWKEKEGKSFFLGVQWHPERMFKNNIADSSLSKNIRAYFIKNVAKQPGAIK